MSPSSCEESISSLEPLIHVYVRGNPIGDEGFAALSSAVAMGALPRLTRLLLRLVWGTQASEKIS